MEARVTNHLWNWDNFFWRTKLLRNKNPQIKCQITNTKTKTKIKYEIYLQKL